MPVQYTEAMKAFAWAPELPHAPGAPDEVKGGFQSACRCGYPGRWVKSSPSHAYQSTRVHAENENRREAGGGAKMTPEQYAAGARAPRPASVPSSRASVGSPRASRPAGGTGGRPCACGCGEACGGLFRPGHDSKLLSRLVTEVKTKGKSVEDAVSEMTNLGCSDKLKAKFEQKVGA